MGRALLPSPFGKGSGSMIRAGWLGVLLSALMERVEGEDRGANSSAGSAISRARLSNVSLSESCRVPAAGRRVSAGGREAITGEKFSKGGWNSFVGGRVSNGVCRCLSRYPVSSGPGADAACFIDAGPEGDADGWYSFSSMDLTAGFFPSEGGKSYDSARPGSASRSEGSGSLARTSYSESGRGWIEPAARSGVGTVPLNSKDSKKSLMVHTIAR